MPRSCYARGFAPTEPRLPLGSRTGLFSLRLLNIMARSPPLSAANRRVTRFMTSSIILLFLAAAGGTPVCQVGMLFLASRAVCPFLSALGEGR